MQYQQLLFLKTGFLKIIFMKKKLLLFLCLFSFLVNQLSAQTAIQTSFETTDGYASGNLNGQNNWSVSTGNVSVSSSAAHTGTQAVNYSATNTALLCNYVKYGGTVPGITGVPRPSRSGISAAI